MLHGKLQLYSRSVAVAATALADRMFNNGWFDPEMVGQIVGQFQVPFVGTGSHIVVFNLMEGAVQGLLIKHAQDFLSHREQAMVLLLNVLAQQRDVGTGVCCETGDGRAHIWFRLIEGCHHRPDVISTFVVLHEHAGDRLGQPAEILVLQEGEQVRLFLAVMTAVREILEEVNGLASCIFVQDSFRIKLISDALKTAEYLFNDAVLISENVCGLHDSFSSWLEYGWMGSRILWLVTCA